MQKEEGIDHVGNHKSNKIKSKPQKTFSYACHICGLNGHKMTDYPKITKMQKMFHGKSMTIAEVQHVIKIKSHYKCECDGC